MLTLDDWITPRGGLGAISDRLHLRPGRIAYLGTSVTTQRQGYRPLLHNLFVQNFQHLHVAIDAGIGGVGSITSVFTMDESVIKHRPDLCLIECTTGDLAGQTPLAEIGPVIEGMIRKLRVVPAQVCFLHLYRRDADFAASNEVLAQYEGVADYYQVPSINVGRYIEAQVRSGVLNADDLYRDMVHTTPSGSAVTGEAITTGLSTIFEQTSEQPGAVQPIEQPCLYANNYQHAHITAATWQMLKDPIQCDAGALGSVYPYLQIDQANEVEFQVEHGELIGLVVAIGPDAGIIEVTVDRQTSEYQLWDQWCHYDRLQSVIFAAPYSIGTRLKIRLTDQPIDYSSAERKFPGMESIPKHLRLIGFMIRESAER